MLNFCILWMNSRNTYTFKISSYSSYHLHLVITFPLFSYIRLNLPILQHCFTSAGLSQPHSVLWLHLWYRFFFSHRLLIVAKHKPARHLWVKSLDILIHYQCTPNKSYGVVTTGWSGGQSNAIQSPHCLLAASARCGVVVGRKLRKHGGLFLDLHRKRYIK